MALKEYALEELLIYEQPTNYIVKSTDYRDEYKIPVLTAGKSFILGYTNETERVFDKLPVIIFDDFTTATQYVNFKFKVKSSAIKILHVNTKLVLPKYIFFKLQVIQFDHSTHKRYWIQHYSKIKIQIPSLKEQERIVSLIDELFSELDSGIETLKKTKEQLRVYRQAVLKEAFEKIEGKNFKVKDVCKEIKVGIVIKPSQYYTTENNGVKAFRSANVREFHIDNFDWVYINSEGQKENKRSIIHKGDVLIVRSGYPGTACVVDERFDGCYAIDVLIAVPNQDIILPDYLCAYTNSPLGKAYVSEKKRGVGQKHFNLGGYSGMDIVVPSKDIQKNIVSDISEKLSIGENIIQTVDVALQQAEALRQSILKEAFEGRL